MEIVNLSASKSHEKFSQIIFKYEWALKKKKSDKIRKKTLEIYYYWKFSYNLCLRLSWATQYYTTIRWEVLWEDKVEGKYLNWLDLDEDSEEKQKEGKSY